MHKKEYKFNEDWPYHVSCGGIVYRKSDELKILLLVKHDGGYDIPKGTLHFNETLEDCALREVEEESGQKGEIAGYLGGRLYEGIDKTSGSHISKITHYFAIKWTAGTGVHDDEYSLAEWVNPLEAEKLLRPSSTEVLKRFMDFSQKSTKHISAGKRLQQQARSKINPRGSCRQKR